MENPNFNRGEVIVFSSGEYSDYSLCAFIVAIEDLNLDELGQEWKALQKDKTYLDMDTFPSWLIAKGLAMPVTYSEVHVGDYGLYSMNRY